jgi:hypothetical protein
VKASPEDAVGTASEINKSTGAGAMAVPEPSQGENQEVKGRFKVKNV